MATDEVTSVLLAGVGGQGVLLAAELLALAALAAGYDVKQTELHGVAQRGGPVSSHVRFGARIYSPMAQQGEVDLLLAFEKLEALRWAHYLKAGGTIIANDHEIDPIRFPGDERPYPHEALELLAREGFSVIPVPAAARATEMGNPRVANAILLGVSSQHLDIPEEAWQRTLEERLPERFLALNQKAFAEGAGGAFRPITAT